MSAIVHAKQSYECDVENHRSSSLHSEIVHLGGVRYELMVASSKEAMAKCADLWSELDAFCPSFGYFQSYDWCKAWADAFVNEAPHAPQVRVYLLMREGKPALVWPMMILRQNGLNVLTAMSEPLGQYSGITANEALVDVAAGAALLFHIQKAEKVDAVLVGQYAEGSFLDRVLGDTGFCENVDLEASIATLDAFDSWDSYQATLSKRSRRQRNQRRNKLNRMGTVDYQVVLGGTQQFENLMDEALAMKAQWLEETGRRSDTLVSAQTKTFFKGLKGQAAQGDMPIQGAVAHVLSVDGKSVGIELGMTMGRHYYSYLGAYDWAWSEHSVGKVQMEATQQWAMEAGIQMFDFLGDPSAYKSNWTQSKQKLKSRNIPISAKGFLFVVIWRGYFRPALKSAYAAMGTQWRKKLSFFINFAEKMRSGTPAASSHEAADDDGREMADEK